MKQYDDHWLLSLIDYQYCPERISVIGIHRVYAVVVSKTTNVESGSFHLYDGSAAVKMRITAKEIIG